MNPTDEDICALLKYFVHTTYRAKSANETAKAIMKRCIDIAKLDYNVSILDNSSGELCAHYPSDIIVLESELNWTGELIKDTIYEGIDPMKLKELFQKARSARCRTRFPVPVIFYQGKYVCRSATLSGGPEIYGRSGLDYWFAGADNNGSGLANESQALEDNEDTSMTSNCNNSNNWVLCDQVRKEDIRLLKALNVGTIVDLMVEKKKVKFGVNVTSSEKVDKENRYANFTIMSLPYPGCEFFRELRGQNYDASNLQYNWEQSHNDAQLIMPPDPIAEKTGIKWSEYKSWSLTQMTDNYLQVILKYLIDGSSGMLVHCISGWDRTPLFISLVRILLWAGGAIHHTLTPMQMLYYTISYDWLLFGHNFPDRWHKGEDIFFFCFDHLKNLMGDEFNIPKVRNKMAQATLCSALNMIPDEMMQCDTSELDPSELAFNQGSNHSLHSSWSSISSKGLEMNSSVVDNNAGLVDNSQGLVDNSQGLVDNSQGLVDNSQGLVDNSQGLVDNSPGLVENSPNLIDNVNALEELNNGGGGLWMGEGVQGTRSSDSVSSGSTSMTLTDFSETPRFKPELVTTTSPVAVPSPPRTSMMRHRNESSSSLSVGSWTYVTTTGSIRSTSSTNSRCSGDVPMSDTNGAACDTVDTGSLKRKRSSEHANCDINCGVRREKLENLREAFVKCYRRSIGHNMADGEAPQSVLRKMGSIVGIS